MGRACGANLRKTWPFRYAPLGSYPQPSLALHSRPLLAIHSSPHLCTAFRSVPCHYWLSPSVLSDSAAYPSLALLPIRSEPLLSTPLRSEPIRCCHYHPFTCRANHSYTVYSIAAGPLLSTTYQSGTDLSAPLLPIPADPLHSDPLPSVAAVKV